MKIYARKIVGFSLILFALGAGTGALWAQSVNIWTNINGGKWEVGTNWSLGAPGPGESIYITNTGVKTVIIDATTSGGNTNLMSVTNITVDSLTIPLTTNTLLLTNAGTTVPLKVAGTAGVYAHGVLTIANSALVVSNSLHEGLLDIGGAGGGTMNFSSGLLYADTVDVGGHGNSSGTLNLNGGTFNAGGFNDFVVASDLLSTGVVTVAGCTLNIGGSGLYVALYGVGQFNLNSGSVLTPYAVIGNGGAAASLTINGGTFVAQQYLYDGDYTGFDSVTVNTNGSLYVTNGTHSAYVSIGVNSSLTLNGGFMQLDNLILTNGGTFTNNSGTLVFTQPFIVDNGSVVSIPGGTIITATNFTLAISSNSTGFLNIANGGHLNITNAILGIGDNGTTTNGSGVGSVTITNGTLTAASVILGSTAGGLGTLMLQSNAVITIQSNLTMVSSSLVVTSTATFSGGTFIATNGLTRIGPAGNGLLTVSGGSHTFRQIRLGSTNSLGTGGIHFLGGRITVLGNGTGPGLGLDSNWILWEGGDLDGSSTSLTIGDGHNSNVSIPSYAFNVSCTLDSMYVGYSPGYVGTFSDAGIGSQVFVTDQMILGNGDCSVNGAVGNVTLCAGTMYVTNASHTAILNICNGCFTLGQNATLVVDHLILTNACGHFMNLGGTLVTNCAVTLSPNLDADGDGQSNAAEWAAGTDPLNPDSVFQMTGVMVSNQDVWVSWSTVGGKSYVVQTNGNLGGQFNDLFATPIDVAGTGENTNNYVDPNAATNSNRFYRVRLGP